MYGVELSLGVVKPNPELYRHALAKLGTQPEETLFIDDKRPNIEARAGVGHPGHPILQRPNACARSLIAARFFVRSFPVASSGIKPSQLHFSHGPPSYAATTSQGKLRDFPPAAAAHAIGIAPLQNGEYPSAGRRRPDPSPPTPRSKPFIYSRFAPGQLVLPTTPASKWYALARRLPRRALGRFGPLIPA